MIKPDNAIHHLIIKTLKSAGNLYTYGDNVFSGPVPGDAINLEEYQNKYETITYFESDKYKVNNSKPWLNNK